MNRTDRVVLAAALAMSLSAPVFAQQSTAPSSPILTDPAQVKKPSAGGLPEKVPFDIPYGQPIGLDLAQKLIAQATSEATRRGWKLNVAVVDPSGELVSFARMDGAMLASVRISQRKARTAASLRRETRVYYNLLETGHPYVATLDPELTASPGGFPLVSGGKIIGAIGCSGGTGDQDAAVCQTALDVLK